MSQDGVRSIAAHTPTPWEYGLARNYEGYYIAPKGCLPTLAAVERCGNHNISVTCFNFPGETEANAALIVRAVNRDHLFTEMLEALKGAQKVLRVVRQELILAGGDEMPTLNAELDRYSALISKAEGSR